MIFDGVVPLHRAAARGVRALLPRGFEATRAPSLASCGPPWEGTSISSLVVLLNAFPKSNTGRSKAAEMAGMTRDREMTAKCLPKLGAAGTARVRARNRLPPADGELRLLQENDMAGVEGLRPQTAAAFVSAPAGGRLLHIKWMPQWDR
jgi:hypothetical protein